MSGRTKVYDLANESASELRAAMRYEFKHNDGVIDANEARLLSMADRVCSHTLSVAAFVRTAVRWLGGGLIDWALITDLRDAENAEGRGGEPTAFEVEIEKEAA